MEPVTLTAAAIIGFVFTKVSETVIEKVTEAALPKINELRLKIVSQLQNYQKSKAEIDKFEQGSEADLKILETYLSMAMIEDKEFAQQVQNMANEINQELEKQGQGSNIMNVYGGKAYQQNQNQGKIYNAETITINEKP
jgi:hypothetical protein